MVNWQKRDQIKELRERPSNRQLDPHDDMRYLTVTEGIQLLDLLAAVADASPEPDYKPMGTQYT